MYYIEKNEKEVRKYEYLLDEERLKEIRNELIDNYSSIIKIRNYNCFSNIENIETDKIKNYRNQNSKVNFDYYIYPDLVILIDMLLGNNISALKEIVDYKQKKFSIRKLGNMNFNSIICNDISNTLNVDFTVKDLLYFINDESKFIINNTSFIEYKDEILKCITFKKNSSMPLEQFYEMVNFLNLDSKDLLNNDVSVVRKKKKEKCK